MNTSNTGESDDRVLYWLLWLIPVEIIIILYCFDYLCNRHIVYKKNTLHLNSTPDSVTGV